MFSGRPIIYESVIRYDWEECIMMSEELRKAREFEAAYEPLVPGTERPLFHVTAGVGWLNDPNGFSAYRGEYHLFYQYHPYSAHPGVMHWGHLKSKDFLKWERLPIAMAPDCAYDRDGCWSGGAAELPDGRQLLMYTGRRVQEENGAQVAYQTQCLAVGDGRDYEKYAGNPVLTAENLPDGCSPYDFRDPKIWREPDGTYRAVTVTRTEDGSGAVLLYSSPDGFSWRFERVLDRCRNEYGNMWECPDFFPLDGKQVLLVSPMGMEARDAEFPAGYGAIALLGRYDAASGEFVREAAQTLDYGPDFYAAQTLEALDGRRIMIAWMQHWGNAKYQPDERLCYGGMTVPRELSIRGGRLTQNPVRELERLRVSPVTYRNVAVSEAVELEGIRGRVLDMTLSVRPASDGGFESFRIHIAADEQRRTTIEYLPQRGAVRIDRSLCGAPVGEPTREFTVRESGGGVKLRLLMDVRGAELFVNDGERAASFLLYTPDSADAVRFETTGGAALVDVEKYALRKP